MPEKTPNPIGQPERSTSRDASQVNRMADGKTSAVADDSALLQRIRQGDQTAMAEVFDRYGRAVYSVALRILKDSGHAEDVMQEIFFQIWRNSDSFVQGRGSLGAWLVVVARNRSIDLLRRRKPTDSVDDVVLASSSNLAAEAEHNAMIEKVQKVLGDLPAEQQRSMEMAFFEGLSHSEIAERTGDPLGTVKTRIRLALITLRKAFQACGQRTQYAGGISFLCDAESPRRGSASIRAHLQGCAPCRAELAEVYGDLALLGIAVEQHPLPPGARERFLKRIAASPTVKPQEAGKRSLPFRPRARAAGPAFGFPG